MYSFGMVLWEIATDGAIPFSDVQFDFEVRDCVVRGERPALSPALQCPEPFAALLTKCWAQDPSVRPSATQATASLTALLESMTSSSKSKSGSDGTSSIFTSFRGTQSFRGTTSERSHRFTNFFRSRFSARYSTRSSTRSEGPDETFAKYASPLSASGLDKSPVGGESDAILGLPLARHRGNSRGFEARLSSLLEYDLDATPSSDISTAFSSSSAESIMSPIVELPIDAMLEAGGTFIDDSRSDGSRSLCSELESSRALTDDSLHASNSSSRNASLHSSGSTWGTASKTSSANSRSGTNHWGLRSGGAVNRSSATERLRREYDEIHDFDCTTGAFMGSRIVGDIRHTEQGISAFL